MHHEDFEGYHVAWETTSDPLTFNFNAHQNGDSGMEMTVGYVKWDGCMNITEGEDHFCSTVNVDNYARLLHRLFALAEQAGCTVWRPREEK